MNIAETPRQAATRLAAKPIAEGFKPEGLFTWNDNQGKALFWRIRLKHPNTGKKWIRPMHLNGNGYVLGEPQPEGKKPIYRVDEIIAKKGEVVWIVEGENKVEILRRLGLLATTSGAADSANSVDWNPLSHREVIIWRDNDDAGLRYATELTSILCAAGCEVRWVDISKLNLEAKGDCVDWLKANPSAVAANIEGLSLIDPPENKVTNAEQWEAPILFDEVEPPKISAVCLPEVFGELALELAESTETPEALSVMTILGVLSAILAKRFVVSPKDGWKEPLNIYTLVALPPANNKSLVLNKCLEPLVEWENQEGARLLPEIQRQQSERKNQEKRIESLRGKAAKEDDLIKRREQETEIIELERNLVEQKVLPQLFINDVTPETFSSQVHEQGGRLAIFSDEGGIVETLTGLYTAGNANVDILLKGIDGGHVRVRRQSKSFNLNPFITIVLTVQPVVIQNMSAKRAFTGNGMLERFLYVVPKSNLGYRLHDKPSISVETHIRYKARIFELLQIAEGENPRVLALGEDAYSVWREFQANVETQLRPSGRLSQCLGWGGKISGFCLRIAGLLHVAEHGEQSPTISGLTMSAALELSDALIGHAVAAYGSMGVDEITSLAQWIYRWIIDGQRFSFTQAEVTLALRNKRDGKKADKRQKALTELIERRIINQSEISSTRKPTTIYTVNPYIRSKVNK